MGMSRLDTPVGYIEVLVNGKPVEISLEENDYDTYYDGDTPLHPEACFNVVVSILNLKKDDEIVIYFSGGNLESAAGDEQTLNAVAEFDDYAIGIGWLDTTEIEDDWEHCRKNSSRMYAIPYDYWGLEKTKIVFHMKQDQKDFLVFDNKGFPPCDKIILPVVWAKMEKSCARVMADFLTC